MSAFFSFHGRICREQFFMHTVLSLFGALALLALIVSGLAIVEPIFGTVIAEFTTAMLLCVTVGVFSWINVATEVKRLHDLNRSGWHWWLNFVPVYTMFFVFHLLTEKGTVGENLYGPDLLPPSMVTHSPISLLLVRS